MFSPNDIRKQFPILANHPDLVYLDSAATTLKPASVIAKECEYYEHYGANIERGLYPISERATNEYEHSREMVAEFLHASRPEEIVFTRGTTEAINLVASSLNVNFPLSLDKERAGVRFDSEFETQPNPLPTSPSAEGEGKSANAEILVTLAEHHSNFLPWQALADRSRVTLKTLSIDTTGHLELAKLDALITPQTKLFAVAFVSNVLGTINPVQEIIAKVKSINPDTLVLIDAAQAAAHLPLDVQALGCDFLAFSAHKMFGPTGVGVLWARYALLEAMRPYQYGGEMVLEAGINTSVFKEPPHKFEAGTPNIAGVIALQPAIEFIQSLGWETIREHEVEILSYALTQLSETFGDDIHIVGSQNVQEKSGVIAFTLEGIHPHDIAHILGEQNICIRAGQHCAQPLHQQLALTAPKSFTSGQATSRLSVSVYTTVEDIDKLIAGLKEIQKTFRK
ncbi:MAG: SufS family cysteine desulfurase [Candidatus Moraniibacteriota bacterium]